MNDRQREQQEARMVQYLKARVSRAQMLKVAGAGVAASFVMQGTAQAAAPGFSFPYYPQITSGTYTPEAIQDILNILDTAEHLGVTLLSAAVANASKLGLTGLLLSVIQAALAEEQYHADFLESIGAKPLTNTFSVPSPALLSDQKTFLTAGEAAETIFVGAYMTAAREFAELGQPTLAKYAYQIGSVEAEHRALLRAALALAGADHIPPNNKAFETDLFLYVRDVAKVLSDLGFMGTTGTTANYPGRAAALTAAGAMAAAVVQQTPNNAASSASAADLLAAASAVQLSTVMNGAQEVPAGQPGGYGTASFSMVPSSGQVSFSLSASGITLPALAAHIHKGPVGVAGPVVIPLVPPDASGRSSGVTTADPALVSDIIAHPSNYYANVHTKEFPAGAIRGQLG